MLRFYRKATQPPLADVARRGADELARWRAEHPQEPLSLAGADLTEANLSGADLTGVDLSGAVLDGASFADARLHDAVLRGASLRRANLSAAEGLLPNQLAGADLTGASLPESISVARMEEAAKLGDNADHARMIFLWMLGGCAFVWLMLISTTQLQLLANDGVVHLPLFDVDAPSSVFFLAGPFLLIAVFYYMHVYMQRMWETLASLPAVFPDGEPIDRKAHGWMLLGLVRWRWKRLRGRPSMFLAQTALSLLLGWGLAPITVFAVWRRCAIRHEWNTSIMQALACALVVFVSLGSFDAAWSAFRRGKRLPKLLLRVGLSLCLLYFLQGVMYATFDGQSEWTLFNVNIEHHRPTDRTPKWGRSKRALVNRYYEQSPFATHDFKGLRDAPFTRADRDNLDTLLKEWRE
ncbi:MAG: pentapeptide repeat-containing protein, partial [Planctomycetales bacterium]|nr:pentapeptide repeat-containing protein [Planctomycetales bacterium]